MDVYVSKSAPCCYSYDSLDTGQSLVSQCVLGLLDTLRLACARVQNPRCSARRRLLACCWNFQTTKSPAAWEQTKSLQKLQSSLFQLSVRISVKAWLLLPWDARLQVTEMWIRICPSNRVDLGVNGQTKCRMLDEGSLSPKDVEGRSVVLSRASRIPFNVQHAKRLPRTNPPLDV